MPWPARWTQIRLIYGQSSTIYPLYSYTLPRDEFLDRIKLPPLRYRHYQLPARLYSWFPNAGDRRLVRVEETIFDLRRVWYTSMRKENISVIKLQDRFENNREMLLKRTIINAQRKKKLIFSTLINIII